MATYSKKILSGCTNGKQIKIGATASPGTLIHTAVAGTNDLDEVWLWASNTSVDDQDLTIEWGETTAPDGNIQVTIPGKTGLVLVVPGLILCNELIIRVFAETTNVVMISGFVNRIAP